MSSASLRPAQVQSPRFWLLKTRDSYDALLKDAEKAPALFSWTVPKHARLGEWILFYGIDPHKSFGVVARLCSDPQVGKDERTWGWLEALTTTSPLGLAEAKGDELLAGYQPLRMLKGPPNEIPAQVWDRFMAHLTNEDGRLADVLREWSAKPPDPQLTSLADSWFAGDPHLEFPVEKILERAIQRSLESRFLWRPPSTRDRLKMSAAKHLPGTGYPDIVLVRRGRKRQLLLVEVKLDGRSSWGLKGVEQADRYRSWFQREHPDWKVDAWLAAELFSPTVLQSANVTGVQTYEVSKRRGGMVKLVRRSSNTEGAI